MITANSSDSFINSYNDDAFFRIMDPVIDALGSTPSLREIGYMSFQVFDVADTPLIAFVPLELFIASLANFPFYLRIFVGNDQVMGQSAFAPQPSAISHTICLQ